MCLHLFQNNTILEKELRQLSTFFFCDLVGGDKEVHTHTRHTHAHAYMRAHACTYASMHAQDRAHTHTHPCPRAQEARVPCGGWGVAFGSGSGCAWVQSEPYQRYMELTHSLMRCKGEPTAMASQCALSSDFELLRHWLVSCAVHRACIVPVLRPAAGMHCPCRLHAHGTPRAGHGSHEAGNAPWLGPTARDTFGLGSLFGVYDTRNFGKFLCCVPRHPQCEKSYVCPGCRALRCRTALPRTTAHCRRACMLACARGRALPAPPRRTRKRTRHRGPDRSTPILAKTVPCGTTRRVAAASPPRRRRVAIGANRRWSARQVPARAAADAAVARGVQVPQAGSPTPPRSRLAWSSPT